MTYILDNKTLPILLDFEKCVQECDDEQKLLVMKNCCAFVFVFAAEFLIRNSFFELSDVSALREDVCGKANTGKKSLSTSGQEFLRDFEKIMPDADFPGSAWMDVFSQDSLLLVSSLLGANYKDGSTADRVYGEATAVFSKFCDLVATEYRSGDAKENLKSLLEISEISDVELLKARVNEVTKLVYG